MKIKDIIMKIKAKFRDRKDEKELRIAKRKADEMHRTTGKRYFVILRYDGKLIVVDNSYIDFYNRGLRNKNKRLTIEKLISLSLYATSSKSIIERVI